MATNEHAETNVAVLNDLGSLATALSGAVTNITSVITGAQTSIETMVSGVGVNLDTLITTQTSGVVINTNTLVTNLLGSSSNVLGFPNLNVGNRAKGQRCITDATETTIFVSSNPAFAFVQAWNDASATQPAEIIVYDGAAEPGNVLAHAYIPIGCSEVVACMPCVGSSGIRITGIADGTHPVCVAYTLYSPEAVATTILQNSLDNQLAESSPNTNYGTQAYARMGKVSTGNRNRMILAFDLSTIDPASVVTGVTLTLTGASSNSAVDCRLAYCTEDWLYNQSTWNDRLTGTPWTAAGHGAGSESPTPHWVGSLPLAGGASVTIDVTAMYTYWIANPTLQKGMILYTWPENTGNYVDISTFEAVTSTKRPALTIYTL